eukprot:TRINITY_DN15012_c0_g1_i1.p1 TRINITY_DN15012_c0_g1~~TRINITY_DN15012_c0_g1_i1.p1  ORF type:complete len:302 (+),score=55.47 TRINITY_DN15012_c0_g1_i1:138-1043(+)
MSVGIGDYDYSLFLVLVTFLYQAVFCSITVVCRFDKLTDFAGGTNFVVNALLTFFISATWHKRQWILTTFTVLWGLRLSLFLFYRILVWKTDKRFDEIRKNIVKIIGFWTIQFLWVYIVGLPTMFVNASDHNPDINAFDVIGWLLFSCGLIIETYADAHKQYYKSKNKTHWCDVGLWSWTRHPNYFGEILLHIGMFISATPIFEGGVAWISIISPIFVILILLFLSGMPILEKNSSNRYLGREETREEYKEYLHNTSPLVPFPPFIYKRVPKVLKIIFFCEYPFYNPALKAYSEEDKNSLI